MLLLISLVVIASRQSVPILRGLSPTTLCLTFHDVIPERDSSSLWFDCSVPELKAELDWLTNHGAHYITLDQLYAHLTTGTRLPKNAVCVTFADNYLGFYDNAYPILKARGIPSAMFVHTGYVGSPIGRPKMNWDQLRQLDREGLVSVESQTVSHPLDLRLLKNSQLRKEMTVSKQTLERQLRHPIRYLAYPNGKFDARSESTARTAGYDMAFSEKLTPAESSPTIFAVSRYVHTKYRLGWREAHRRGAK